ncbi:MAG TPA: DUF3500 domain-containing protein [Chitinophagaceae bacterium]|nr:DUF3500 domain-containing protein [Chitinophagaceae bacterium]
MVRKQLLVLLLAGCLPGFGAPPGPGVLPKTEDPAASRIVQRADLFIQSLESSQRDSVVLSFDDPRRKLWSNNSYNVVSRPGISLGQLSDTQRVLLQALLQAVLSPEGYLKLMNTLRLDDWLHQYGATLKDPYWSYYGSSFYWIAFFGEPSGDGDWGMKFEGHHFSLNVGFRKGKAYAGPLFLGAHPDLFRTGPYAGFRFLEDEKDQALALVRSLDGEQRKFALISPDLPPSDDVRGASGKEFFLHTPEGISIQRLDGSQKTVLLRLLKDFTGTLAPVFEKAVLAGAPDIPGNLHFAWMGPESDPDRFYYALESPGFSIEFILKEPLHIHTLMREAAPLP